MIIDKDNKVNEHMVMDSRGIGMEEGNGLDGGVEVMGSLVLGAATSVTSSVEEAWLLELPRA